MADLGTLALLLAGVRHQRQKQKKSKQEELARYNAEKEWRQAQFDWQKQQSEKEEAWRQAAPFLNVFQSPNSADIFANMAESGTLGGWLDNAEAALKRAGFPFDVNPYRVRPPRGPGVDLSGVGAGSQAPPVGAPPEGLMGPGPLATPGIAGPLPGLGQPGTPVPRMQRMSAGVPGPPTPIAALPAERLARLFAAPPPGTAGPPVPISDLAIRPEHLAPIGETPAAPAVPPALTTPTWDEAEAYRERYRPGVMTRAKIGRMVQQTANDLVRAGVFRSQIEKNEAQAAATRLLADPRARLMLSQAGYYDERTQTEVLLRDPRVRRELASALNLEDLPGSRAADRATRERIADKQIASRERVAAARAIPNRATDAEKARLKTLEKVGWAHERDMLGNTRVARDLDELYAEVENPTERQIALAKRVTEARRKHEALVAEIERRESAPRTPAAGGATAPTGTSTFTNDDLNFVRGHIRAGTFGSLLGSVADGNTKKRLMTAYRQITGKTWSK